MTTADREFIFGCLMICVWAILTAAMMISRVVALSNNKSWSGSTWTLRIVWLGSGLIGVALVVGTLHG